MRITEIRIKLSGQAQDRLRGFCTITFDGSFVVRDVKIIDGPHGVFVAMPSRKLMDHCPKCRTKNHLRARFCNHCGSALNGDRYGAGEEGPGKLHCDVAHPINGSYRSMVQDAIIKALHEEEARAKEPGYVAPHLEELDDDVGFMPPKTS